MPVFIEKEEQKNSELRYRMFRMVSVGVTDEPLNQAYDVVSTVALVINMAVMVMNTQLGYKPVTFAELTTDDAFWKGCEGCVNVDVLHRTDRKYCICTGMLFDPTEQLPAKIPEDVLSRIKHLDEIEESNN